MNPLPLPVRIAAGLVATAVEQVRELPRLVIEFPVTAVSQALQTSMRVQQLVTELAIKGDRALSVLNPAEETPAWATFDEDVPPAPRNNRTGTVTELRRQSARRGPTPDRTDAEPAAAAEQAVATPKDRDTEAGATEASANRTSATKAPEATASENAAPGPTALPGYPDMSIPQLRARLRKLDEQDLRDLLAWETDHDNRPPFVTMLSNRLTTVTEA